MPFHTSKRIVGTDADNISDSNSDNNNVCSNKDDDESVSSSAVTTSSDDHDNTRSTSLMSTTDSTTLAGTADNDLNHAAMLNLALPPAPSGPPPVRNAQDVLTLDLIQILRKAGAKLETYSQVLTWAAKAQRHQFNFSAPIPTRKLFLSSFAEQLGISKMYPKSISTHLPHANFSVPITVFDATAAIHSLLTDVYLMRDDNFLFYNPDDPFSAPPLSNDICGDLIHSDWYCKTYHQMCNKSANSMLVPILLYIDKTQTDKLSRLSVEPVNLSLGLFKRSIRNQSSAWRPIGYIPDLSNVPHKHGSTRDQSVHKAQDLHVLFDAVLSPLFEFIKLVHPFGFMYRGKLLQARLHFKICFIIGDTEGHDRMCGHFTARTHNVKQLCRRCLCPNTHTDDPDYKIVMRKWNFLHSIYLNNVNFPLKTRCEALSPYSQQPILNSFYGQDFGCLTSDYGIHAATPSEMLHQMLLGTFKMVTENFFRVQGVEKTNTILFDSYCVSYGKLVRRQSDRDVPRTSFTDGLMRRTANLTAKEYSGVLLLVLIGLIMPPSHGVIYPPGRVSPQQQNEFISLVHLIETLLCWEQWLRQDSIPKSVVQRSVKTHRQLMHLIKLASPRSDCGMELKLIKFHQILHVPLDIIMFGVASNYDSGPSESNHIKMVKLPASNTQRQHNSFSDQTALRYVETLVLESASYAFISAPKACTTSSTNTTSSNTTTTSVSVVAASNNNNAPINATTSYNSVCTGMKFFITKASATQSVVVKCITKNSKNKAAPPPLPERWVKFVDKFCLSHVAPSADGSATVSCYTEHKRLGIIFRGCQSYRSQPWHDWAMVQWGNHSFSPIRICFFVDLGHLNAGCSFQCNGIEVNSPGVYAVGEQLDYYLNQPEKLLQCKPILFDVAPMCLDATDGHPLLCLVNVESFSDPVVVLPMHLPSFDNSTPPLTRQVGSKKKSPRPPPPAAYLNHYLVFKRRTEWAELFHQTIMGNKLNVILDKFTA